NALRLNACTSDQESLPGCGRYGGFPSHSTLHSPSRIVSIAQGAQALAISSISLESTVDPFAQVAHLHAQTNFEIVKVLSCAQTPLDRAKAPTIRYCHPHEAPAGWERDTLGFAVLHGHSRLVWSLRCQGEVRGVPNQAGAGRTAVHQLAAAPCARHERF